MYGTLDGAQHDAAYRSTAGNDHPARNTSTPITSYATHAPSSNSHHATRQPNKQDNKTLLYVGVAVAAYFLFKQQ
jgi:hypothetical protein